MNLLGFYMKPPPAEAGGRLLGAYDVDQVWVVGVRPIELHAVVAEGILEGGREGRLVQRMFLAVVKDERDPGLHRDTDRQGLHAV